MLLGGLRTASEMVGVSVEALQGSLAGQPVFLPDKFELLFKVVGISQNTDRSRVQYRRDDDIKAEAGCSV